MTPDGRMAGQRGGQREPVNVARVLTAMQVEAVMASANRALDAATKGEMLALIDEANPSSAGRVPGADRRGEPVERWRVRAGRGVGFAASIRDRVAAVDVDRGGGVVEMTLSLGCGAWLGATAVLLTMYAVTLARPDIASRQVRRERYR